MKKIFVIFAVCSLLVAACKKSSADKYDCTGLTPTYNGSVKTIIDGSCAFTGCHTGTSPADGLNLSGYSNSKSAALNSSDFLCSIEHGSGYHAMPQGASKLSDDKIKTIACWIQNGAPEN